MRASGNAVMVTRLMVGASVGCLVCLGCAGPPRNPEPADYVFFSHYPELSLVSSPPGVFLYTNPRKPIRDQDLFIVNPAQIGFQPQAGHWLSPAESQKWADFLRNEVIASLSERYQVVDTPDTDVLRVSLALADIRLREPARSPDSRLQQEFQPFLIIRITDSATGEAVVLLRDLNRGDEFVTAARSDEATARQVLSEWASTLGTRLEDARRHQGRLAEPQY